MGLPIVLIIDLDESLEIIAPALQDAGFQVVHVSESTEEVTSALHLSPLVIIIGGRTVSIKGTDLLPFLRSVTDCPIVAIGIVEEMDMVKALLEGADVCLREPLNVRILIAHIRALLRRYGAS
jgi:two-component system OmpR family response regulator